MCPKSLTLPSWMGYAAAAVGMVVSLELLGVVVTLVLTGVTLAIWMVNDRSNRS